MYKMLSIGETVKDVFLEGLSKESISSIQHSDLSRLLKSKNISATVNGGAPANVAAYYTLLGNQSTLVTSYGSDKWGQEIANDLKAYGVDVVNATENPREDREIFTDCALIKRTEQGHEFVKLLWGALPYFEHKAVKAEDVIDKQVVYIGSVSSRFSSPRNAVFQALNLAKKNDVPIFLDVNLREVVYQNNQKMFQKVSKLLSYADIVKCSEEEARFLLEQENLGKKRGCVPIEDVGKTIIQKYSPNTLFITRGKEGAMVFKENLVLSEPGVSYGEVVSTVGAGDAFCAGVISAISSLHDGRIDRFLSEASNRSYLQRIVKFGCEVAGKSVISQETISNKVKEIKF